MSTVTKKYERLFDGLVAQYEETRDVMWLEQMYKMISDGKIVPKGIDFEHPAFYAANKFDVSCCKCNCKLAKTTTASFAIKDRTLNKYKYWCIDCATSEEKQDPYYINYMKKQSKPMTHQDKVNELMAKADAEIAAKKAGYLDDEDE